VGVSGIVIAHVVGSYMDDDKVIGSEGDRGILKSTADRVSRGLRWLHDPKNDFGVAYHGPRFGQGWSQGRVKFGLVRPSSH
jgi:hypothetical protein